MRRLACFLIALSIASVAKAEDCPAVPDQTAALQALFAEVREAKTIQTAQPITNKMWAIWAKAPNETAQEILDRGLRRRASRDYPGAVADFEVLIKYCPDYAEGYNQRAYVKFIQRDYATALADLDRTLELSPHHLAALAGKALTLIGLGREVEGQALLRDALEIHPWLPERRLLKVMEDSQQEL